MPLRPSTASWPSTAPTRDQHQRLAKGFGQLAKRAPWKDGRRMSLRWILTHMIEEYARHNGHADLLRESVDGLTGE